VNQLLYRREWEAREAKKEQGVYRDTQTPCFKGLACRNGQNFEKDKFDPVEEILGTKHVDLSLRWEYMTRHSVLGISGMVETCGVWNQEEANVR
jgi:hypothetical protein